MRLKPAFKNAGITLLLLCLSLGVLGLKNPQKNKLYRSQKIYFSPNGQIKARIVGEINNARNSVDIAVFNITSYGIKAALTKALKRGVQIRFIADLGESENERSVIGSLIEDGVKIKLLKGKGKNGLMHHKFAIFDGQLLLTGSYNWTETAEHYNYENALFLDDKSLVKGYQDEFERLWSAK